MKTRKSVLASLMLVMAVGEARVGQAQPDPNNAPKAANPPVMQMLPVTGDWQKMTPEQRKQAMQQMVDQTLRGAMTWLGFADKDMQDAVVESAKEEEDLLEPVRLQHRKVAQALLMKTGDNQSMQKLMADLRLAINAARNKREDSLAALDAKTHFTQNPRLEAFLTMMGMVGDENQAINGVMGNYIAMMMNVADGGAIPGIAGMAKPPAPAVPTAPPAAAPPIGAGQ